VAVRRGNNREAPLMSSRVPGLRMLLGPLLLMVRAVGALALVLLFTATAHGQGPTAAVPPAIGHVFVIVLENEDFDRTFGPGSDAPYLARALTRQGMLLKNYYGTGHYSLDNYLAMLSGQAATPETRDDCEVFAEFVQTGVTQDGQAIGSGCVYPASVKTLPDQLTAKGLSWRAYLEDMGNDPEREAATCGRPPIGARDPTQAAEAPSARVPAGDQYAARHNPFVYFHSIIDSPACATNVVSLARLASDLATENTTPNFVFIAPNLCNDGHDAPCVDGQPGGLTSADRFLQKWAPQIMGSPAYRRDGLLIITFDEGGETQSTDGAGKTVYTYAGERCCNEQPGPNLAAFPQTVAGNGYVSVFRDFGGDRTGTVLLSPFLTPGTESSTPFNHYSLLRTLEDLFGTDGYLGYAGQKGLVGFFGCSACDISTDVHRGMDPR
jgi:phosphatidylinositol-3-phosphatase